MRRQRRQCSGFTLIELIIVIVLLGVMGLMGAEFIAQAFKAFFATNKRMEIYEEGKAALMRIEQEIHISLPNALVVLPATVASPYDEAGANSEGSGETVNFAVIDEGRMAGIFGKYAEHAPTNSITDLGGAALAAGTSLVSILNTRWNDCATGARLYNLTSDGVGPAMTLSPSIPAEGVSPQGRYFLVRDQAVRFGVDEDSKELYRETVTLSAAGVNGSFGGRQPLAKDVEKACVLPYFRYQAGSSSRNSVLVVNFAINKNGEKIAFHKEIQIRNVP